ncbi:MAG: amino acid deaminase/aldolase [bacterium]
MTVTPTSWKYDELRRLVAGERLPLMVVDLDVLDANTRRLTAIVRQAGMTLRVASKSFRVPALLERVLEVGGATTRGLMCFSAAEADFLSRQGFDDLLVAYPTVQEPDLELLWDARERGVSVTLMIDSQAHVDRLELWWATRAAGREAPRLPVCVDADMSYRPLSQLGPHVGPHLGAQRSPVRDVASFRRLLRGLRAARWLELRGVMGYEAQLASLGEINPFTPLMNPFKRLFKARSARDVARKRAALARCLEQEGFDGLFFNGGGTGSIRTTTREPWLTEVTAGSGFLQSHLFDYFSDNRNEPACCFALPVTRLPEPGVVTCQSGGFIASGEIGPDKAPVVFLPQGLEPFDAEGFGEVQTPLKVPANVSLALGDPVFLRPAKAGEIAERFNEYLLKRASRIVGRAKTYRGFGHCFY